MAPNAKDTASGTTKQTTGSKTESSTATGSGGGSRNAYAKDGWGSRQNFRSSYGLKPGNGDDWDEGNRILDALNDADEKNNEADTKTKS